MFALLHLAEGHLDDAVAALAHGQTTMVVAQELDGAGTETAGEYTVASGGTAAASSALNQP